MTTMGVAAIQMQPVADRDANVAAAGALVDEAAAAGAALVVLPEIFAAPFVGPEPDDAYFAWAEPLDGPSNQMARDRSAGHGIAVVSSIFEASTTPGVYHNTACTYVGGEAVSVYRKSHLPFSNGFPEKYYFQPGDEPPATFDVGPTRAGVIICYERHFPELGRLVALGGASVLCIPVACASAPTREVFELELRAHAVFNSLFIICSNRVGAEGAKDYYGSSAIYAPDGGIVARAESAEAQVVVADIDLDAVVERRRRLPFFRDRRPELYQGLVGSHSDHTSK